MLRIATEPPNRTRFGSDISEARKGDVLSRPERATYPDRSVADPCFLPLFALRLECHRSSEGRPRVPTSDLAPPQSRIISTPWPLQDDFDARDVQKKLNRNFFVADPSRSRLSHQLTLKRSLESCSTRSPPLARMTHELNAPSPMYYSYTAASYTRPYSLLRRLSRYWS